MSLRAELISDGFVSEPYEAGWASEATVFADGIAGDFAAAIRVQISPDGLKWFDEGTLLDLPADGSGAFARVKHFGNWLRLRADVPDSGDGRLTLTLHLKA